MTRIKILFVSALVLMGVASNAAASGMSCDDWRGWASSTARLYVSQTMGKLACDATRADQAEDTLADKLSLMAMRDESACFFEGLYAGYISALRAEYADCDGIDRFDAVSLRSVSIAASSVAIALFNGLAGVVDHATVHRVFNAADLSFLPLVVDAGSCADLVYERVTDGLGTSPIVRDYADKVARVVCFGE